MHVTPSQLHNLIRDALPGSIFTVTTEPARGTFTDLAQFAKDHGVDLNIIHADIVGAFDFGIAMAGFENVITGTNDLTDWIASRAGIASRVEALEVQHPEAMPD